MRTLLTITLAATCLFAAPAAFAENDNDETYFYKLDLSAADTAAGAREAYADIRRQAARFCRVHSAPPRNNSRAEAACRVRLVAEALAQADREEIHRVHAERQSRRARR